MRTLIITLLIPFSVFSTQITDLAGRVVNIPKAPKKIICLSPGTLRLISYLQATELVVGIEELEVKNSHGRPYWLADNKMKSLPIVAPGGPAGINKIPDLEKILKIRPDLIFVTLLEKKKADDFQRKIGIPVVVLSYGRFASFDKVIFKSLSLAGKILGKTKRANDVVNYIKSCQKDLSKRKPKKETDVTAFIGGLGFKGGHGIESTDSTYIPFEWVGVQNVAKKIKKEGHLFINKEKLLELNPDFIFIDGGGKRLVRDDYKRKNKFYDSLAAFKNKQVFTLFPFNWYTTNVGSMIIDAYAIGKTLYPGSFADISINKKAKEVYQFLVGKDVYQIMLKDYGKLPGLF